jgi:hypothetical protein
MYGKEKLVFTRFSLKQMQNAQFACFLLLNSFLFRMFLFYIIDKFS